MVKNLKCQKCDLIDIHHFWLMEIYGILRLLKALSLSLGSSLYSFHERLRSMESLTSAHARCSARPQWHPTGPEFPKTMNFTVTEMGRGPDFLQGIIPVTRARAMPRLKYMSLANPNSSSFLKLLWNAKKKEHNIYAKSREMVEWDPNSKTHRKKST